MNNIPHGITGYSNYGCRCDICRSAKSESCREYRNRPDVRERIRIEGKIRRSKPGYKELQNAYQREWNKTAAGKLNQLRRRQRDPLIVSARAYINHAVRDGRATKLPCQICGDTKSQAHHFDYTDPGWVMWLCTKHHREVHAIVKPKRK